jgi:Ca2+-binding RTX toxin-like protein
MRQSDRHSDSTTVRRVRPARLVAWGAAALAAVAGGAAMMAAPGNAAPTVMSWHLHANGDLVSPQVDDGVLKIYGTREDDRIALRLQAGRPGFLQVDFGNDGSAESTVDLSGVGRITLDARGGSDSVSIDESNGRFTDVIPTTIDGGSGDDRLAGGSGAETLIGGSGNDSIDGNRGNDAGFMGAGDDTFIWDPGDGSDTVEGGGGHDTMLFNGANVAERVDLSANGNRLLFFRDPAGITMDTNEVERVDFVALGGADVVTVNELRGTDVREVNVTLGADGVTDRVIVNGSERDGRVTVRGDADAVQVKSRHSRLSLLQPEGAFDRLDLNGLGGKQGVESELAGTIGLFVDGVRVS